MLETRPAQLSHSAPLGSLNDSGRKAQNPHIRILPAFNVDRNSVSLGERLGEDFKFLAIKPNPSGCRVSEIFDPRTNFYNRLRFRNSSFNKAHDTSNCTPRPGDRPPPIYMIIGKIINTLIEINRYLELVLPAGYLSMSQCRHE